MNDIENPHKIEILVRDYEYWRKRKEWKDKGMEEEYVELFGGSV